MTIEMKNNKNNNCNFPTLRFPEFLGEWKKDIIGNVISVKSEKYNPHSNRTEFICVELESISQGTGELLETFNSAEQKSIKNKFSPGTVLFGKLRPYLRKFYLPYFEGVCSSEIWVMRSNKIEPAFLYSFIQTPYFISLANQSSGSKMPRADWGLIETSKIAYPPNSAERVKIGKFLKLIDERIATQNKIIEEYKKLKNALAELFFAKSIEYTSIGEMCDVVMGQSPSSVAYNYTKNGLPLIQGNLDIFEGVTSPRMWTSDITKQCDIGDIILTVRAPVGDVAKSNMIACVGRGVCAIKVKESGCSEYVYQYLLYFKAKWGSIEQGSTFSAISRNDILNINIPVITKRLIVASHLLALFDSEISIEALNLNVYTKQKQYLLTKMFI